MRTVRCGFLIVLGLAVARCTLTSSLDDLKGNPGVDAGGKDAKGGSDGSSGSGGSDASGGTGGSDASGGTGGSDASGGTGGQGDAAGPCADAGPGSCFPCCSQHYPAGAQEFVQAIKTCVCATGSTCATACTTYCNSGSMDATCTSCVQTPDIEKCLGANCQSNACQAYLGCASGC